MPLAAIGLNDWGNLTLLSWDPRYRRPTPRNNPNFDIRERHLKILEG